MAIQKDFHLVIETGILMEIQMEKPKEIRSGNTMVN